MYALQRHEQDHSKNSFIRSIDSKNMPTSRLQKTDRIVKQKAMVCKHVFTL